MIAHLLAIPMSWKAVSQDRIARSADRRACDCHDGIAMELGNELHNSICRLHLLDIFDGRSIGIHLGRARKLP